MTPEGVARGGASGGAAAHDRRKWQSVQDRLEAMDNEEYNSKEYKKLIV